MHPAAKRLTRTRRMAPLATAIAAAALLAAGSPATAQDGDLFFDTVDVNVVNIEVLVTDKAGVSVTGLSREEFTVYEDGEEVELSNFFEVVSGQAVANDAGPDTPPPVPDTQRLQLVIFVDNANPGS